MPDRVQRDLRMTGRLVRVVDAGEVANPSLARLRVHALVVARLTYVEWRVHEHFDEAVRADHVAQFLARASVGAHGRANDDPTVAHDLGRDVADAPYVGITIFLAEAQALGQQGSNHVAIQQRDLASVREEGRFQDLGGGRLPRPAETREPDA